MCHNHSHIKARFLGENTAGPVPVLTYALADRTMSLESPYPGGAILRLQTSGLLYLPSWMLDGWSAIHSPAKAAPSMSLCFMPDDAAIIMQEVLSRWPRYGEISLASSDEQEDSLNQKLEPPPPELDQPR